MLMTCMHVVVYLRKGSCYIKYGLLALLGTATWFVEAETTWQQQLDLLMAETK